jgi:hypothetical protein
MENIMITTENIGIIDSIPRTLFEKEYSPLRIIFHDDDSAKDETLGFIRAMQEKVSDEEGSDATILIRTNWEDAYKLIAAGIRLGSPPFTDAATAQVRISGYAMIRAGVLTEDLRVTVELTDEERRAGHLPTSPSLTDWQNAVMSLYIENLGQVAIEMSDPDLSALYGKLVNIWKLV